MGPSPVGVGWIAAAVAGAAMSIACGAVGPDEVVGDAWWTHLAATSERDARTPAFALPVEPALWVRSTDSSGASISFEWWSSPVVWNGRVYALGRSSGSAGLFAFSLLSGQPVWKQATPTPVLDSWSSPAIDRLNGAVVTASGTVVRAFDAVSGSTKWSLDLGTLVVNASPLVTEDLGPSDRVLVTDYSGFGPGASLHCINADPFHPVFNPHLPGALVWSVPIGQGSGSTAAYADGSAYVASADGTMRAFVVMSQQPPNPTWVVTPVPGQGFFGGVVVDRRSSPTAVLAATYSFSGGIDSARLVKVDAQSGAVLWTVPTNRTNAMPVLVGADMIALSGGLRGFGTVPSVRMFLDEVLSARVLWDSALDSWCDSNGNNQLDPGEYLDVGGWSHQAVSGEAGLVVAGVMPTSTAGVQPYEGLRILDGRYDPKHASFSASTTIEGGGSAAIVREGLEHRLLTIGATGLASYRVPCRADCDLTATVNIFDLVCFSNRYAQGDPWTDCDGSGTLTIFDYICFVGVYNEGCQ